MSNYSDLKRTELSNFVSTSIPQNAYQNITQNDERTITHSSDPSVTRRIQIWSYVPGSSGVVNTTLDFDVADEGNFTQEDSVSGTDFVGGKVTLHNSGTIGFSPATLDPSNKSGSQTLSNGNKTVSSSSGWCYARAYPAMSTGKWYWEVVIDNAGANMGIIHSIYSSFGPRSAIVNNDAAFMYAGNEVLGPVRKAYSFGDISAGTVVGVYFDADNKIIGFTRNGVNRGVAYDSGLLAGTYYPCIGQDAGHTHTIRVNASEFTGIIPDGYLPLGDSAIYPTNQKYYITTNSNSINLTNIDKINSCTYTVTTPTNTSLETLISFDGKSTWLTTSGSNLIAHSGPTTKTNWSSIANMQTALTSKDITSETSFDVALLLGTTNSGVSPEVDLISTNVDENGTYKINTTDYEITCPTATTTKIKKTTSGTHESIKVNIDI